MPESINVFNDSNRENSNFLLLNEADTNGNKMLAKAVFSGGERAIFYRLIISF